MSKRIKFIPVCVIILMSLIFTYKQVVAVDIYPANTNNYKEFSSSLSIPKNKVWSISFNKPINISTINKNMIEVTDEDGKKIDITVEVDINDKNVVNILPPTNGYTEGKLYTLIIKKGILSSENKELNVQVIKKFFIGKITNTSNRGNTIGNLINKGFVAFDDKYNYYKDEDIDATNKGIYYQNYEALYKINKDNNFITKIHDNIDNIDNIEATFNWIQHNRYLNIVDDWIYYIEYSNIYAMKKDGSFRKCLSEYSAEELSVVGDSIYYISADFGFSPPKFYIYKMNLDGSNKINLTSNDRSISDLMVTDNYIFFSQSVNGWSTAFYRMNIDGSEKKLISNDTVLKTPNINGDWIYYINLFDNYSIYKMKLDGSEKTKLSDESYVSINIFDDQIYYIKSNAFYSGEIYKMDLNCKNNIKICDDKAVNIFVTNDWIYYFRALNNSHIFRIRKDGTEKKALVNIPELRVIFTN